MPEERKLVTILFADVTGSTALADTLDFEDVRALMSRYYDHARRIVSAYNGTVEKFIGDAVMAIFGLSQVHEDDPERALVAALELREAVASDEILSSLFRLRIGVNTGEVMATNNPDRLDFLVTGDVVNVAARVQQGANPGEILVSERTTRAAQHAFLFEEARLIQAKGKPQPLRVFPLQGSRSVRQIEHPPFVGREADLIQLETLKKRTLDEQRPQLVSILAPAGTGKSRLLEEFLARLEPTDGFQTAFARCVPYGHTHSNWPVRGLLTDLLGGAPTQDRVQTTFRQGGYNQADSVRLAELVLTMLGTEENGKSTPSLSSSTDAASSLAALGKLGEKFANLDTTLQPLADPKNWIKFPELRQSILDSLNTSSVPTDSGRTQALNLELNERGQMLGKAITEQVHSMIGEFVPSRFHATDRESIYTAWQLLIEVLAPQAPHVLVFEDLHWGSDALLELVEHLAYIRTPVSLLLVVLSRPELQDRRPTWGHERQNFTLLSLQPLDNAEILALLLRVQVDSAEDVRRQIVERSSGNPFFALELLKGYTERVQRGEGGVPTSLPDTVHAAVLARIDLLSRQERTLLQAASIANRPLSREMLLALLDGQSEQEMNEVLTGLQNRELLIALENGQYTFRHALIRDVAYGTLSRAERIRLHSRIALWMQTTDHLDAYVELIAYHYREAIQLARQSAIPLDLSFDMEDAARIFELAGLLAGRSGAYEEAKDHLKLAIELAPLSEHARLYEALGESIPHLDTSYEAYQKALESWRKSAERDPGMGARLIRKILIVGTRNTLFPRFAWEEWEALRQEALLLLANGGDKQERLRIRLTACFDPRFCDDKQRPSLTEIMEERRALAKAAAAYFEQYQNWEALSEALDAYSYLSIQLFALPDALSALHRRLAIPDLPEGERAYAVGAMADCYFLMGDYPACIDTAAQTFASLKPGQPVASLSKVASNGAIAAFVCGRWEEIEQFRLRLDEIRELVLYDQSAQDTLVRGYLAALLLALAREDRTMIDAMSTMVREHGAMQGPKFSQYLNALLADDATLSLEDHSSIGDTLRLGLFLFMNEHGKPMPTEELTLTQKAGSGYYYWSKISLALAENDTALLHQAIEEAEKHDLLPHAARMRVILAQRSGDLAALEQARIVLRRLDDRQFLHRLDEVVASLSP